MSGKRNIKIAVCIMAVLTIAMFGGNILLSNRTAEIQQNMKEYLQKSYNKEFVVGKVMVTGNEGFGYRTYVAEAYPQDDPNLKFHVKWEKGEPGTYDDSYLVTRRSAQGKIEIGNYLKKIYGQDVPLTYKLSTRNKELQGLDHDELLSKYGKETYLELVYYVFVDKVDKEKEAERAYKVLEKFILNNQPKYYYVIVHYLSNNYKEEFYKGFTEDANKFLAAYDSEDLHNKQKLINKIVLTNTNSKISPIDNIADLSSRFKY